MKCKETGKCFAREHSDQCSILRGIPYEKPCPFKKENRGYTDGKYYPWLDALGYANRKLNDI